MGSKGIGKGMFDIVFLMDATSGMGNGIQKVKDALAPFFDALTDVEDQDSCAVRDWRAKVVGFRDFEADGADDWFVDNPFTHDIGELQGQFDALKVFGGGGGARSLLDAMYTVISTPKSERNIESPRMWRDWHEAERVLIVFTDAPYKPLMVAPWCHGGRVEDVNSVCVQEKILLMLVAPSSDVPAYSCFDLLAGQGDFR